MKDEPSTKWDTRLPHRIFATDRYPDARLNVYSKPDILTVIVKVLKGTAEFEKILSSPLGSLFSLRVCECPISCKLIHALLCRQLPMRFSLLEFGAVTCLDCSEFPEDYDPEENILPVPGEVCYWDTLIGDDRKVTFADVSKTFEDPQVTDLSKKLRLALLLIVDGVLIASSQTHRPTFKYVEMLEDVDSFLKFPWGRESFMETISSMRPAKKSPLKHVSKKFRGPVKATDPVNTFTDQLQQKTFRLNGFPLSLQLLAYRNISGLLDKIPGSNDPRTFLEWDSVGIPKNNLPLTDVHALERASHVSVAPYSNVDPPVEGWGEFDDEVKDRKISYMVSLIDEGHEFNKLEWPGGDSSLPTIVIPVKQPNVVHRRHIVSRRKKSSQNSRIRQSSSQKARRSSLDSTSKSSCDATSETDLKDWFQSQLLSLTSHFEERFQKLKSKNIKLQARFRALRGRRKWNLHARHNRRMFKKRISSPTRSHIPNEDPNQCLAMSPIADEPVLRDGTPKDNHPDDVLHSEDMDILGGDHDWTKYSTTSMTEAHILFFFFQNRQKLSFQEILLFWRLGVTKWTKKTPTDHSHIWSLLN
ncbi:hypothetical protein CARUB_v10016512mg, partial [Capsella rubella]